ncbi:hypothetical protein N0824_01186 [Microcystis sp. 0824]|nr:hypothetical protein N0824_01186 [Microcystis sp. 0824]
MVSCVRIDCIRIDFSQWLSVNGNSPADYFTLSFPLCGDRIGGLK